MTDKTEAQHEAPRLADRLEDFALALPAYGFDDRPPKEAAAELRRQHASVQKLEAQLITQTNRAASAEQQITALTQRLDMANAMGNEARDKLAEKKDMADNWRRLALQFDGHRMQALASLVEQLHDKKAPTNVAQVRQLSPFRYPGGKTWLVPEVRKWLTASKITPSVFVEPFAGGAMAGLSAAAEGLAEHVFLGELDDDVAAVWQTIFHGKPADVKWLCKQIIDFDVNLENVREILDGNPKSIRGRAFRTIVKNRMQRGGIMAAGAGLVKTGEAGRGLNSRWYPETLARRIEALQAMRDRITFEQADAFEVVQRYADDANAFFFVDPPYTAGGKKAGARLYTHNEIDHEGLFALMASVRGSVMLTYDEAPEVRSMAERHGFRVEPVPMKNTHHEVIRELLILKP